MDKPREGISGGLISMNSFLLKKDRTEIKKVNLRNASVLREASKDGLQSLYADAEDTLEKYDGTDVVKVMNELRDEKLLWVRARAIDADTVNANGDFFSKAELLKEVDIVFEDEDGKKKRKKAPAYKTFEGVPIFANHKNDDVLDAKGMVVHAEWDEDENCVYVVFYVDETTYPDIVRGIRVGYMHDVSMGCQVQSGECSECKHVAATERDYCECLKKHKGKPHPKSGRKVYEKNMGLKFIELSVVGDGAFDTCAIEEIYDPDEILQKALNLEKHAQTIHGSILLTASSLPTGKDERVCYEGYMRSVAAATNTVVKVAQTLVGGPIMAGEGADQNATVANILQYLGIDAKEGLNVLDMLNLALNFLEVAVINMFARKDNVDLAHVSKISKAMADLQATMQDLIDDGVDTGGGNKQPLNQGSLQQGQQPQGQPGAAGAPGQPGAPEAPQDYAPAGAVGQQMTQNQAFMLPPEMQHAAGGGGAFASSKNGRYVVWAEDEEAGRSVYASTGTPKSKTSTSSPIQRFAVALGTFAETLGLPAPSLAPTIREADNKQPTKQSMPVKTSGGKHSMSIWEKFTQQRRLKQAAKATEKLELEDKAGNKIVISSKGDIEAYHANKRIAWEPSLSDEHLDAIAAGKGLDVTAELLYEFGKVVSASKTNGRVTLAEWEPYHGSGTREDELGDKRTGAPEEQTNERLEGADAEEYKRIHNPGDKIREELLDSPEAKEYKRGEHPQLTNKTREQMLGEDAGLYGRNFVDNDVKEHLLSDARHGNPDKVIELQLDLARKDYGPSNANLVVKAAIDALGRAVISSKVTPEEIVDTASKLAERTDLTDLIQLAHLGNSHRRVLASRNTFHGTDATNLSPVAAVLDELGAMVTKEITAADLSDMLITAKAEATRTLKSVTIAAKAFMGEGLTLEPASQRRKVSRTDLLRAALASQSEKVDDSAINRDHLKAALMAFAATVEDAAATPKEIVAAVEAMDAETLTARVELARSAASVEDRLTVRARKEFFGSNRFASKRDVEENVIGWMADYAIEYNYPSSALVEAAMLATRSPKVAVNLVTRLVEANTDGVRNAGIQVTDEKTTTKRINCTVSDLGGLDPKAEDFEDQFKQRAIQILADSGFSVDPSTFTMNEVNVDAQGAITASVTSRFSKTFDAASSPAPMGGDQSVQGGGDMGSMTSDPSLPQGPEGGDVPAPTEGQGEVSPQGDVVSTASFVAHRIRLAARRKDILARYAQMGGGAPGGMGGAMPMAGGGAPAGGADPSGAGAGADGMGLSALTAPPADPMAGDEDPAADDSQPEPGTKKPLGSICPQCGGTNVDLANGQGHCNDCGAEITVSYNIEVKPGSEEENKDAQGEDKDAPKDDLGAPPALGGDTGLGAATAPAGAPAGGAPPMGAGAPPMGAAASRSLPQMVRISWLADPDIWVESMQEGFDADRADRLPVGQICPSCGDRHAKKVKNNRYCYSCGEIYIPRVHAVSPDSNKVLVSIDKIL